MCFELDLFDPRTHRRRCYTQSHNTNTLSLSLPFPSPCPALSTALFLLFRSSALSHAFSLTAVAARAIEKNYVHTHTRARYSPAMVHTRNNTTHNIPPGPVHQQVHHHQQPGQEGNQIAPVSQRRFVQSGPIIAIFITIIMLPHSHTPSHTVNRLPFRPFVPLSERSGSNFPVQSLARPFDRTM